MAAAHNGEGCSNYHNPPIEISGIADRVAAMRIVSSLGLTLWLSVSQAYGFALLGPYADWMDSTKNFRLPGEVGGPMNISEGYRWNVPVVTYGFERSFLDYFGSNGVAAVEAAVALINQLPPASLITITNFPVDAWRFNYQAQALGLVDLKSTTLSLLLEQMGLARPEPSVFCVRDFVATTSNYLFFVIQRNFDQTTAQPSAYVNESLFTYSVIQFSDAPTSAPFCDAQEVPVDPLAELQTTVAGFRTEAGAYAQNLSRDDVGGLRFLLNGEQIRFEQLLSDVHLFGGGTNLVRSASRAGVEKVTLVRQPGGTQGQEFEPVTNHWTDVYFIGAGPGYQEVERITTQPDILFSARDLGPFIPFTRTTTTNWVNNADLNGNPGGAGPGVIQPKVEITFNNVGRVYYNYGPTGEEMATSGLLWGSFDGGTNAPLVLPGSQVVFQPSPVHLRLAVGAQTNEFHWLINGAAYGRFAFQTSSNLSTWQTMTILTNSGSPFTFEFTAVPGESSRFFRTTAE